MNVELASHIRDIIVPTPICRIEQFLDADTASAMLDRIIAAQPRFKDSLVGNGMVDPAVRRSKSRGMRFPELEAAVRRTVPHVEPLLGLKTRSGEITYELTAHNDGDFFGAHVDASKGIVTESRIMTFVFYLHRVPIGFDGGQLRIYDAHPSRSHANSYRDVQPDTNSIVFFPPTAWHEVRAVRCVSGEPADSRFSVNGWIG